MPYIERDAWAEGNDLLKENVIYFTCTADFLCKFFTTMDIHFSNEHTQVWVISFMIVYNHVKSCFVYQLFCSKDLISNSPYCLL